jgi:2-oxoglutarate ferredoxin oxidoreductase subunit delta
MQIDPTIDDYSDCKIIPGKEKKGIRVKIHILSDRCKECNLCINFCPKNVLKKSDQVNQKGYHIPKLEENPEESKTCLACGFCEIICPEYAIWVEEIEG